MKATEWYSDFMNPAIAVYPAQIRAPMLARAISAMGFHPAGPVSN